MRCRSCQYALWNLSEPRCPECGREFDLRTYRFNPGTVEFACPRCDARHPGQGDLHVPTLAETFHCAGCGADVPTITLRVIPTVSDLALAEAAEAEAVPWEDKRFGWWGAWWQTLMMSFVGMSKLADRLGPRSRWGDAYWFAALTHMLGMLIQVLILGAVAVIVMAALSEGDFNAIAIAFAIVGGAVVFVMLYSLLFPLLIAAFVAGPAHLYLRLTGETRGGYGLTVTSTLYAQGPMVLWAIPVCGYYFNGLWQLWALIGAILITMKTQRVSGWRAAIAFLWLPGVMFILSVGVVIIMMIIEAQSGRSF